MEHIEKKNGFVYLVHEDSNDGRFKTYYNLGKDPDLMEDENSKQKKGKVKKDED